MFRPALTFTGLCAGLLLSASALALSLSDLSQKDATGGLKDALTQGAQVAVKQLGTPGGFSANPDVRIELPGNLGKVAKKMKQFGMGDQVEQLEASMNKAAEAAVPQAQALLVDAVKKMTVDDAKGILAGGNDSATQYLSKTSREQIRAKFLPIVKAATDKVGVVQQYNSFAGQASALGLGSSKSANVESYVTEKALDGLFE
ncbi:MAG: DUF4197 domain-containing protein, partial [Pseudomonas sp.]